nr:type II secretion system F family protein [Nocardiopsis trehalosi]
MLLEFAVVALGTAAVRLLGPPGRVAARRRLAALLPGRPRAPRRSPAGARAVRWLVPVLPAVTLAAVAGPVTAVAVGVPAGWALGWWAGRDGARSSARDHARIVAALPIAVDLLVAGLRAGGTPAGVLAEVARAVPDPLAASLGAVHERLRLGADPSAAWEGVGGPPELAAVGRALARAADTGAPVGDLLERQAAEARATARTRALARSQRVGVLVVAPLGLCFLPAFVLIGVVPLAAGLVGGLLGP